MAMVCASTGLQHGIFESKHEATIPKTLRQVLNHVTNLLRERLESTPESRGHGQVLQPPSRRTHSGLWESIRHDDPKYFISTREKFARDMVSRKTRENSHLAHMVREDLAKYVFDRSEVRQNQRKFSAAKSKGGRPSSLPQAGMATKSVSNSLYKHLFASSVAGRTNGREFDHVKGVRRQKATRSVKAMSQRTKSCEISIDYNSVKDVGRHHTPGAPGGWVDRVQKSVRGERMMLDHLLSLVQSEQKREIERESILLTMNVDRRQRSHLAIKVSKERAESADWIMRIMQNYGIISSATFGKYLTQLFRADAAPTSSELATMTKDHEIGIPHGTDGRSSNSADMPVQISSRRLQCAHSVSTEKYYKGLGGGNTLVFHAEQWGGWGRHMSAKAETIIGQRAHLSRVNDARAGIGSAVASDPTSYSFLMRRSIAR